MTALVIPRQTVEAPVQETAPVQPMRLRANSSCLALVARFLIWATRNS